MEHSCETLLWNTMCCGNTHAEHHGNTHTGNHADTLEDYHGNTQAEHQGDTHGKLCEHSYETHGTWNTS
jgi:hypothetical protein